jgi:hypothetical protein
MSTRSTLPPAARLLSFALALAVLTGFAACANTPTAPGRSAEWMQPRLDEGDTTDTGSDTTGRKCDHTQPWECAT